MLEVEYLCGRVVFICKGRILDEGSPNALKKKYNAKNLKEAFIRVVQHEL